MFDCPFVCGVIRYLFVQVQSDKTFQRFEVYERSLPWPEGQSLLMQMFTETAGSLSLSPSSEGKLNMLVYSKTKRSLSCRGR